MEQKSHISQPAAMCEEVGKFCSDREAQAIKFVSSSTEEL